MQTHTSSSKTTDDAVTFYSTVITKLLANITGHLP